MYLFTVDLLTSYFSQSSFFVSSPFLISASNIERSIQLSTLQDFPSTVYPSLKLISYFQCDHLLLYPSSLIFFASLPLLLSLSSISTSIIAQSSSEYSGDSYPSINYRKFSISVDQMVVCGNCKEVQIKMQILFQCSSNALFSFNFNEKSSLCGGILFHFITLMLSRILALSRSCNLSTMQQIPQLAVYYVTASSTQEAELIASALVQNKLAACANIVEGVKSIYIWQGKVNKDNEVLMIIKSRLSLLKQIEQKVKSLHSYKVPQVIAIPIASGSQDYTNWVISNTIQN